eukprot:TRINITY_DN1630_c0_g1_i1.p1 TRINITY_DN1630_c0_g1~~TRINITY_DN1630_c0_g1_i1.p1  ORF type:complete len:621 (+),score=159.96 TRINITY_DN1630_c0_g1_i1:3-1865(+)
MNVSTQADEYANRWLSSLPSNSPAFIPSSSSNPPEHQPSSTTSSKPLFVLTKSKQPQVPANTGDDASEEMKRMLRSSVSHPDHNNNITALDLLKVDLDSDYLRFFQEANDLRGKLEYHWESNRLYHPHDSVIRTSIDELILYLTLFLETKEKDIDASRQFNRLAGNYLYMLLSREIRKKANIYEALFNPARASGTLSENQKFHTTFLDADSETKKAYQNLFLKNFLSVMRRANFTPLTETDFRMCTQSLKGRFRLSSIPIEVDWRQLESSLLPDFFDAMEIQPSILSRRCLFFWRGINTRKREGYFFLEKLDFLLLKVAKFIHLPQFLGNSDEIPTKIETEKTSIHEDSFVDLKSLNQFTFSSLWQREEMIDPIFEEVVILYRQNKKKNSTSTRVQVENSMKDTGDEIYIQRFFGVPLQDIQMLFPCKKLGRNWADFVYLFMIFAWVFTIFAKILTVWDENTYWDEAALAILFFLAPSLLRRFFKIFISSHTAQRKYNQLMTDTLYNRSLNCNKGVMSYVRDVANQQDLKEALLAYFIIWRAKRGITSQELDAACESLLLKEFNIKIDFEVQDALAKFKKDGLIDARGDLYYAVPIHDAITTVSQALSSHIDSTFSLNFQ